MGDICETVARVAARWRSGETAWRKCWDVMEEAPGTVGDIVDIFRAHIGGPAPLLRLPGWMMTLGTAAGDAVAWLAGGRRCAAPPSRKCAAA